MDKYDELLADELQCSKILTELDKIHFKISFIRESDSLIKEYFKHVRAQRKIITELRDKTLEYNMGMFD